MFVCIIYIFEIILLSDIRKHNLLHIIIESVYPPT